MNAYLHIPFCASICSYCDFTSFAGKESKIPAYLNALEREISHSGLKDPLQTVYFGGGTPSLLSPEGLGQVLEALGRKAGFLPGAEISMEVNPETVDLEKLKGFKKQGINRLSFGAQSSQKEILKGLGRGHEWAKVEQSFQAAREAGFESINLDLMFGLAGQTPAMFQESLEKAEALGPDHFSLYALQVEEGTPLSRQVREGLVLPNEDAVADEYAFAQKFLAARGFEQYEVSNFARAGKICRHNWNIWRGEDYWGFGVGAVGTVEGVRVSHGEDLAEYIKSAASNGEVPTEKEILSPPLRAWEKIMLGFRTKEGVLRSELENYAKRQGVSYEERFNLFKKEGFLSFREGRFAVTPKGYFVLNGLLEVLAPEGAFLV